MNLKKETVSSKFWTTNQPTNQMDVLTPHKLSIVFLIQEYLAVKNNQSAEKPISSKYRRQFCMLLLKLIQYPDMSYKDLYQMLTSSYGICQSHLDGFNDLMKILHKLGIEILFDLQSLMDKLMSENATVNGGVSQYGIVGLYLRRVHVTLDKMSFPELMALYKNVTIYYEKGLRALVIGPNKTIDLSDTLDTQMFYKDRAGNQSKWSIKQAELFVAQQSALLQNNEPEALDPVEMETRLKEIIHDNPLYSQAHFLSYMNNLRVRDYLNSLDALHRASSMIKSATTESKGFQYSSLNLAILNAKFGYKEEALTSLRECIMLAQENGDRICLQIAQSWLCFLDKNQVQLNEKSVANKTELSLVHSVSLGIQFVVKTAAQAGYMPAKLFELLLKSDILNCQHSMMDLIGNCIAEKAAVWTLYGKNELASLCSQLLLNSNLKTLGKINNGEGNCHSLCSLAMWLSLQGEFNLSAVILEHARERFPRTPLSENWMICDYMITSTQSIYTQKWQIGTEAIQNLYTLDRSLSFLQFARLNIARGNITFGQEIVEKLLKEDDIDHLTKVNALIIHAHTMMTTQYVSPEAAMILNTALGLATEKHLEYEAAIIKMNLAYFLLRAGMPKQAFKNIKDCIETILANGGIYDKAKCNFLFIKCMIAATETNEEKIKKLRNCTNIFDEIIEYFTKLECYTKVKDIYFYIANFYNDMNMEIERNRYAYLFRIIEEQYPTSHEYLNVFF